MKEDELYSSEQLAIMVAKGDIDYAVCDQQIARVSKGNLPEIDIDTDISFTQLQSWAVRKDSPYPARQPEQLAVTNQRKRVIRSDLQTLL